MSTSTQSRQETERELRVLKQEREREVTQYQLQIKDLEAQITVLSGRYETQIARATDAHNETNFALARKVIIKIDFFSFIL